MSGKKLIILITLILCMSAIPLMAQPTHETGNSQINNTPTEQPATQTPDVQNIGRVLIVFLVLSIVFEVALTPIFNWRLFLQYFEGKGYKTPTIIVLAFVVFWGYELDIVKDLLNALNYQAELSLGGQFLTSLLIAGGSDGVFRIFTKLGIRNPIERKEKADEAREEMRKKNADDVQTSD